MKLNRTIIKGWSHYTKEALARGVIRRYSHQITLTGSAAVGKSSLRAAIASDPRFAKTYRGSIRSDSGGGFMRPLAEKLKFPDIGPFAAHNLAHPKDGHDLACDQYLADLAATNGLVLEGRMVHVVAPRACHVLVICGEDVAATRRAASPKQKPGVLAKMRKRNGDDSTRYTQLYPGWDWPMGHFDYVCYNDEGTLEQSVDRILTAWECWQLVQGDYLIHDPVIWE